MWALVNPIAEQEQVYFEVFGTGHLIWPLELSIRSRKYLGTLQALDGLVWHVFKLI